VVKDRLSGRDLPPNSLTVYLWAKRTGRGGIRLNNGRISRGTVSAPTKIIDIFVSDNTESTQEGRMSAMQQRTVREKKQEISRNEGWATWCWDDLTEWAGSRSVERGRAYVDRYQGQPDPRGGMRGGFPL
jgi:hypothetical protein